MAVYLKEFSTHSEYEQYINGSSAILPNVSLCVQENEVHYNPSSPVPPTPTETRVVAKYNVTSTSSPTQIASATTSFSEIEIDGVEQPSVISAHTFDTLGEHTVKYTLADPTSIGSAAFYNCNSLTSITIPSGVTRIGDAAFYNCNSLTSIDIPSGVTRIDDAAFYNCNSLTSCTIGSGVTIIGYGAFKGCSGLTSIVIPNSVTSIGQDAFQYCSGLTSITSNATTAPNIGSGTFCDVNTGGTLRVPIGSSGYDVWMGTGNYYLGKYNWTKVEQ